MLAIILLLVPNVLSARYFVSPGGNDANAGTDFNLPWKSTKRANEQKYVAGDWLLFEAVTHSEAYLKLSVGQLPKDNPLTVSSYYGQGIVYGRATLLAGNETAVTLANSGGVVIRNLTAIGTRLNMSLAAGIHVWTDMGQFSDITVSDLETNGFSVGILIENNASTCGYGFSNVFLTRVKAHDAFNDNAKINGVWDCLSHRNFVVTDSVFSNSMRMNGLTIQGVDGATVLRSTAFQNGQGNPNGGPYGIWAWNSNNVYFGHSVSYRNHNGGTSGRPFTDGGGFDFDGGVTNSVMEYCLTFQNDGPGFGIYQFPWNSRPTQNLTIRYSVSWNDNLNTANRGTASFYTPDNTLSDVSFISNTFGMFESDPITAVAATVDGTVPVKNVLFAQNAFLTYGDAPFVMWNGSYPGLNFSGNSYWSTTKQPSYVWCPPDQACTTVGNLFGFRNISGLETDSKGKPTGTDDDPNLQDNSGFFGTCVPWVHQLYPSLPNSKFLDSIRGFSGC